MKTQNWLMLNTRFFNPTDATRVAGSPRIGVGPGFDSQGSVTFFNKYCFPNLYWIHWVILGKWFGHQLQHPKFLTTPEPSLAEQKCSFPRGSKSPFSRPTTAEVLLKAPRSNHSGYPAESNRSRNALVTPMVDVQLGNAVYKFNIPLSILKPGLNSRGSRKCMPVLSLGNQPQLLPLPPLFERGSVLGPGG